MTLNSGGDARALDETVMDPGAGCGAAAKRSLTARERFELLFDPDPEPCRRPHLHEEPDAASWPVLSAVGCVNGMAVCAITQDALAFRAGLDATHWRQIQLAVDFACRRRLPLVAIFDGTPTQLAGGLDAWTAMARSAGGAAASPAPKLALLLGANTGPGALLASLFDAVIMTRGETALTLTDATIANRITNTCLDEEALGGWKMHAGQTGLADMVCDNEVMGIRAVRRLLEYSADSAGWMWPGSGPLSTCPGLETLMPDDPTGSYDVRELLREISDTRSFLELGKEQVSSMVTGFAPVGGRAVGLLASQNKELAGALDIRACRKALRHLRLCAAMGVPVVTFVDVPGFVPGQEQEAGGLALQVAELVRAYACAPVPKITVVMGKALGAAGAALGSRATLPDRIAAWRGAGLGWVGGPVQSPERPPEAVAQGHVAPGLEPALHDAAIDAVIEPEQTRQWLGETVASLCRSAGT